MAESYGSHMNIHMDEHIEPKIENLKVDDGPMTLIS